MIKAVSKFWGSKIDQYGMPDPYHSYFVVASPWETPDSGVATVLSLSTNSPLSKPHFLVTAGGERAAFEAAISSLKGETKNAGLTHQTHES